MLLHYRNRRIQPQFFSGCSSTATKRKSTKFRQFNFDADLQANACDRLVEMQVADRHF